MRNVPAQIGGCVLSKPDAGDVPERGKNIIVDDRDIGNPAKKRVDEPQL